MTKTVSARIPNKTHSELIERCNKAGCTINEWINEAIQYLLTSSSEFDFGDDEELDEKESVKTKMQVPTSEITQPTVTLIE